LHDIATSDLISMIDSLQHVCHTITAVGWVVTIGVG